MIRLTAEPVNAGTHIENWTENRPYGHKADKGGWIQLHWEVRKGVFLRRTIQVDRVKAVQAMAKLAKGGGVA